MVSQTVRAKRAACPPCRRRAAAGLARKLSAGVREALKKKTFLKNQLVC